jgi:hypothetical protein
MSNTTETTNNTTTPIIFLDTVGRTIMALPDASSDDSVLTVKNPVVIMVGGDNSGKMSVQLFPLFFREFLADKNADVTFSYKKDSITLSNIEAIDFRLQAQYSQMFSKTNSFVAPEQPQQATEQKVVNLFDE